MFSYYRSLVVLSVIVSIRVLIACEYNMILCMTRYERGGSDAFEWQFGEALKNRFISTVNGVLPSPHAELLLGMVIGIDRLKNTPTFNDVLRRVGTIHVVVVSGYNINLVFDFIFNLFGGRYKVNNVILAQVAALIYALISGFKPPVIRAWIMSSVLAWGKFYGRRISPVEVLVFSALVMIFFTPFVFMDLSFQLSFLATLGLAVMSPIISAFFKRTEAFLPSFLVQDFVSSMSAQIFVWPLISYRFNNVSLIGPIVNALVLWTVPLSTVLGIVFLVVSLFSVSLASVLGWVIYIPLDIFVSVCEFLSTTPLAALVWKVSLKFLVIYYLVLVLVISGLNRHAGKAS